MSTEKEKINCESESQENNYKKKWYAAHPGYNTENMRAYRLAHPEYREKQRQQARAWRARNKETLAAKKRQWRKNRSPEAKANAKLRIARWQKANRVKTEAYRVRRVYKIKTIAEAITLVERRLTEPCNICGKPAGKGHRSHIDHCHKTGKIRGILCITCNRILGNVKDNPTTLRALAVYLEKHR